MLMRFDPFRELDEIRRRMDGGVRYTGLPMDAYRRGDEFIAEFDLPGIDPESVDLTVERNMLEVTARRAPSFRDGDQVLVAERPQGSVTRQLLLGDGLDTDRIDAAYEDGVLSVRIPVAEEAKPHKVAVKAGGGAKAIRADSG